MRETTTPEEILRQEIYSGDLEQETTKVNGTIAVSLAAIKESDPEKFQIVDLALNREGLSTDSIANLLTEEDAVQGVLKKIEIEPDPKKVRDLTQELIDLYYS